MGDCPHYLHGSECCTRDSGWVGAVHLLICCEHEGDREACEAKNPQLRVVESEADHD